MKTKSPVEIFRTENRKYGMQYLSIIQKILFKHNFKKMIMFIIAHILSHTTNKENMFIIAIILK